VSHTIRIADRDIAFACEPGETILDAAERAGFTIPYSCRKGVCSSCAGVLAAGRAVIGRSGHIEGPAEAVRFCQARPCGDVEIIPVSIASARSSRKRLAATVHRIGRPAGDISVLSLRLPIGRRVPFRAGQYLRVHLGDGESRSYSLANAPQDNDRMEIHVRHVPGGRFSEACLTELKPGGKLDVELPYGTSCPEDGTEPLILAATGTGFAPVQSIVEDLARRGASRPVHLFWGGRTKADLYAADRVLGWAERHAWFRFTPVLSRAPAAAGARAGRVQDAILAEYRDMSGCVVHACGNPAMVAEARHLLTTEAGLPASCFHADAFLPSGTDADT
jgi:NAD(P)H-flavin reductase/ferredoxin